MPDIPLTIARPLAQSGRTVRRWESGGQDIPGAVAVLVTVLLASPEARLALGLPAAGRTRCTAAG